MRAVLGVLCRARGVKIWREDAGIETAIYDNKLGESLDSYFGTILGSGSNVILTGKPRNCAPIERARGINANQWSR